MISLYETHPQLYDVKNKNYRNKTKRLHLVGRITKVFCEKFKLTDVTIADVKRKINSLRTQYTTEKNKIKKSIVSGSGADEIYKPTLWCFPLLRFQDDGNPVRDSESSLDSFIQETEYSTDDPNSNFEILYDVNVDQSVEVGFTTKRAATNEEIDRESPDLEFSQCSHLTPNSRPTTSYLVDTGDTLMSIKKRKTSKQSGTSIEAMKVLEKAISALEGLERQNTVSNEIGIIDAFAL